MLSTLLCEAVPKAARVGGSSQATREACLNEDAMTESTYRSCLLRSEKYLKMWRGDKASNPLEFKKPSVQPGVCCMCTAEHTHTEPSVKIIPAWIIKSGLGWGGDLAEFIFLAMNRPESLGWSFKCIGHLQAKSWLPKQGASNLFLYKGFAN